MKIHPNEVFKLFSWFDCTMFTSISTNREVNRLLKYLYLYSLNFLKAHEALQFGNMELIFQMKNKFKKIFMIKTIG